jgi:membrane protein implicated in regulation of membrane protease activity
MGFEDEKIYNVLGFEMNGVGIWIAFKVALVMPLSALYAWFLTRIMQRYRIPDGDQAKVSAALIEAAVTVHPSTGDPKTAPAERKPAGAGSSGG